eukprot:TRINITY_DN2275_c0_g1_i5.p1 TRINITY_DN2275_c0_g1~~TRINITY_DN2275_c0_g1_i5.p1  ORF type:complete len:558 (+),score=124.34 TRINITY_DN2275_c0_g1_i5:114-1787(+)
MLRSLVGSEMCIRDRLLTILIIFAINTIYMPFLKTALMILACHPLYQCEFEHCWTFITQDFALAAFLSVSVVLVLGVGFPILLLMMLFRRRKALNSVFFGEEYADRYVASDTHGPEYNTDNILLKRKELSTAEWARFGAADNSALAQQYADAAYRWLMMPAFILVFKVAVLIPVVFLEPRSFSLRLGSGVVEIAIAIFYFSTNTQLSPILLMTIRAASVHQLLVLGLQNINLVLENDSTSTSGLSPSTVLIAVTLFYVAFTIVVLLITAVFPIFASRRAHGRTQRFLNQHGFDYSSTISLYLEPNGQMEIPSDDDKQSNFGMGGDYDDSNIINNATKRRSTVFGSGGQGRRRSTVVDGGAAIGTPTHSSQGGGAEAVAASNGDVMVFDDLSSLTHSNQGDSPTSHHLQQHHQRRHSSIFQPRRRQSSLFVGGLLTVDNNNTGLNPTPPPRSVLYISDNGSGANNTNNFNTAEDPALCQQPGLGGSHTADGDGHVFAVLGGDVNNNNHPLSDSHQDGGTDMWYLSLIHISEPTRLLSISYAVFCLKKKKKRCTRRGKN